ncbi:TPA: hypothetical protein ACQ7WR_002126 [Escherichia coli]|uniref:hypothetical protein n=1 Tax=Escherichia coli TaxID=562 RepID=UPI001D0C32EA|nr:hypothetical protein [Escherichia coli]EMD4022583.1 hypothetical protein [Escherichia coli]
MMVNVTQESLAEKIKRLESLGNAEYALGLTLNEEYQLAAYRMLLRFLDGTVEARMENGHG